MKLGTYCSWSIPVTGWCLYWTGPLTRLHMKKQKTEPFWCSARGTRPYPGRGWPFWASSLWPSLVQDIFSTTDGGHLQSKWHFVNSKKTASCPSFATFHLFLKKKKKKGELTLLFCPLKNVLFYNYSTCEITLTQARLWLTTQTIQLSQPPGRCGPIESSCWPWHCSLWLTWPSFLGSKCLPLTSSPGVRGCQLWNP